MAELSDETLMAFADGELDRAERVRVEAILAEDAAARARLAVFQATGRSLASHFRALIDEPVPRHLIDVVMQAGTGRRAVNQTSGFSAWIKSTLIDSLPRWPVAATYATGLLIAAGAGWTVSRSVTQVQEPAGRLVAQHQGRILADGVLRRTLETAPSRVATMAVAGTEQSATVTMRLTYRNQRNEFCRQYELHLPDGAAFAGIGCRAADGNWQVQAHVPMRVGADAKGQTTTLASNIPPELDALVERSTEGDVLGAAEEGAAIGKQWRP